jgi:hypothetical protein
MVLSWILPLGTEENYETCQHSRFPDRYLIPWYPKYETGVLITRQRCSVIAVFTRAHNLSILRREPDESIPHTHSSCDFISIVLERTVQWSPWATCQFWVIQHLVTTWPHCVLLRLVHRHPNLQEQGTDMSYGRLSFETFDWDAQLLETPLVGRGGGVDVLRAAQLPSWNTSLVLGY